MDAVVTDGPATKAGRETVRRSKTRERLMDAAYRMFASHGINGTSIEAIADAAGFTRGAFYSNFDSKTELFFALAERENNTRLASLRRRIPEVLAPLQEHDGKPDRGTIEQMCAQMLPAELFSSQWCLMYGEFRMLAMRDADVAPRFLAIDRGFHERLAELMDAVVKQTGLAFAISPVEFTKLMINHQESAMRDAILSNADDPGQAAKETMMRSLPTLIDRLSERS